MAFSFSMMELIRRTKTRCGQRVFSFFYYFLDIVQLKNDGGVLLLRTYKQES